VLRIQTRLFFTDQIPALPPAWMPICWARKLVLEVGAVEHPWRDAAPPWGVSVGQGAELVAGSGSRWEG